MHGKPARDVLYQLLFALHDDVSWLSWLNVLRYTSTRILLATLTALVLSLILYPWFIRTLQKIQLGQVVRDDGPKSHFSKRGTPTMGGSLILFCLIIPTVLWSDMSNGFVLLATAVTAGCGVIGFIDDGLKIRKKNSGGLPGKMKLLLQFLIAGAAVWYLFSPLSGLMPEAIRFRLAMPFTDFYEHFFVLPEWMYLVFATLVVVGFSNAVNLTDGLDGLAIGPVCMSAATFLVLTYAAGTLIAGFDIARYLNIPHIPGVGELAIYCGAMCGAGIGFLWYNTFPASVFMGDVGSLPLGAGIGFLAVASKNEFTLVVVGGIFVLEAVSVIVQVVSFKLTGKRVFKMAPIHHHFELKGWSEPKVVVRFWIISFMLALIGLATLKLR
ncbi:phospho-N-acetylmuramoyl-pentapeptide-transferase [Nannocystis sp. ILAH1]|jgi:phospho-N-acetylmuramoyl-pentapeptide-transferase|uniref:phospho-N-acetylmuramoyl-pentapeptide- transferase n=1 Tax=unclassified Nannocystis TaxID=2627009 RepID=UPI00226F3E82|nr:MULTISPECIES: phospho-N-acetylmuramoyl-pentapeptide-transferase [unclassified Nannocystis]MCY0993797.1 phospho-N-acetylmuramoyl-pentapeptide-transferase [Nannocystis sp. ILAH1]MCY1065839.1 phospho-N-acetylmuramoyl-pentapeptide-transferase [Nannocystis sp. RBIL2]